jgi:Cd2+/Zn2+-exporting ATPase
MLPKRSHFPVKGVFLLLVLASVGIAGLIAAVVADVGTSLLVTLNGMRLFGVRSR